MLKDILLVVLLATSGTFIGWMFGFDFNNRNADTGTFALMWFTFSCSVWLVYTSNRNKKS